MHNLLLYFQPRILLIMALGTLSGIPLALTSSTLSVWLVESGVDKTTIGLFAAATTPYALKFLWSPLMDQLPIPYFTAQLGRRRSWIIFTQILLIAALLALGSSHPATAAGLTAIFALLVAIASASQDIVIDAYRVDLLKEEEQGMGAAVIVFGYRIGMLLSGAGALFLASFYGWFITYLVMAGCISTGIIIMLFAPSPTEINPSANNTSVTTWLKHAVIDPFLNFMERGNWSVILLFVILYKLGDAFAGVMTNPFLLELGFTKVDIATIVKSFGLAATLIGAFIGGSLVHRVGVFHALLFCGILQMLSNLAFIGQYYMGNNIMVLSCTIGLENLSGGMGTAAFVAYISNLCNRNYSATQYALLSSFAAFGRTWLSTTSGGIAHYYGWVDFFIVSTIIALPGILLLVLLKKNIGESYLPVIKV